ncbi:glutamine synthetase [Massilia sp. H-1]|nr:glutamine synthetase [Massilia sp. H-1]
MPAMALAAPYVNSYRRIVRHATAPINVQWGWDNRTTGFRVPEAAPHERHVENRVIGADANPYLALAVTLACGYLGMSGQCRTERAHCLAAPRRSTSSCRKACPRRCACCAGTTLRAVLGERFVDVYAAIKDLEHREFMTVISPWEREHLLLHV